MRHLRGLQAQILLWTILPLILILVGVSLGSITLHQSSMRTMVAERDGHLARLAAGRLNDRFQTLTVVLRTILDGSAGAANLPSALADVQPAVELFDRGLSVYGGDGALLARVCAWTRDRGTRRGSSTLCCQGCPWANGIPDHRTGGSTGAAPDGPS